MRVGALREKNDDANLVANFELFFCFLPHSCYDGELTRGCSVR